MDCKIGFEMNLIVVEAIRGRCASFTVLTATVSEIFGGQTTPSILVVYIACFPWLIYRQRCAEDGTTFVTMGCDVPTTSNRRFMTSGASESARYMLYV